MATSSENNNSITTTKKRKYGTLDPQTFDGTRKPYSNINLLAIEQIYKLIAINTGLAYGSDVFVHNLPKKRTSRKPGGKVKILKSEDSVPKTVSLGYGELLRHSFQKILDYMMHEAPHELRLGADSYFLDIGSGYGKTVFHTKLAANVKESMGVEYLPERVNKAVEVMRLPSVNKLPLTGVSFCQADATSATLFCFTHLYCYDYVFSSETMSKLLPIVDKSNFKIYVCYSSPPKLRHFKIRWHNLGQIPVRTIGNEHFPCYFYSKKKPEQEKKEYKKKKCSNNN
jgi:hypothetical protein